MISVPATIVAHVPSVDVLNASGDPRDVCSMAAFELFVELFTERIRQLRMWMGGRDLVTGRKLSAKKLRAACTALCKVSADIDGLLCEYAVLFGTGASDEMRQAVSLVVREV